MYIKDLEGLTSLHVAANFDFQYFFALGLRRFAAPLVTFEMLTLSNFAHSLWGFSVQVRF